MEDDNSSTSKTDDTALKTRTGRPRSKTIVGTNPFETPLTPAEQSIANLIAVTTRENEREKQARAAAQALAQTQAQAQAQALALAQAHAEAEALTQAENLRREQEKKKQRPVEAQVKMSYQNYMESGGPSNPRQAPPSPQQNMNHGNGMNGAMGIGGGMVGFPTPAGHQSDLNYIMNMIDEFSAISQGNQRLTAGVVDKIGRVTERAKELNLNNNELIGLVSQELEGRFT
jgi:hypothetical protein